VAFKIQPAKAEGGTIYIRADGSIDPPTAPIRRDGGIYTFTGDINDSIVVERDNIVVDGAGYTVQGTGSGNGIDLLGRSNVTVKNTTIRNFYMGIYLNYTSKVTLIGNNITNAKNGIVLGYSSNNIISGNTMTANNWHGIYLYNSANNIISGNNIANNGWGIWLHLSSNDNIISGNNITATAREGYGIALTFSSNNIISGNKMTADNGYGIFLSNSADNNVISGNNISNNQYGIVFGYSSSNSIYHNDFTDNAQQVYTATPGYPNYWDNGYPSGGNHWSNYTDVDLYSGPYQNETGSDGIWDHPYVIDADNQDHYPLTNSWRASASGVFDDDFETYDLGSLDGQGGWSGDSVFQVVEILAQGGTKSGYSQAYDAFYDISKFGTKKQAGIQSIYIYFSDVRTGTTNEILLYLRGNSELGGSYLNTYGFRYNPSSSKWEFFYQNCSDPYNLVVLVDDVSKQTWHLIQAEFNEPDWKYRLKLDSGNWSGWLDFFDYLNPLSISGVEGFSILTYGAETWFDTIDGEVTRVQGIDVSHDQGEINWSEVYGAGYRFAFVKATEGDHRPPVIVDPNFATNMKNGSEAGLLMGAYHVAHPEMNNATDEALFFVSVASTYLKESYLRPALDLEQEIVNKVIAEKGKDEGKKYLSNWVETWISTVREKTGVEPIIYVSSDTVENYLNNSIAKYDLWIADWTYNPAISPDTGIWESWDFWQWSNESKYASLGYVPGVEGNVDLDVFNGDARKLHDTFVIPGQPPTCVVKLQKDGMEINEIDVGQFFNVYVGDSTDDVGIKQVRFSSDDAQDDIPTGEWTEWYDWDVSAGDWNAETKIKEWSFTTGVKKEIWAQIKDGGGNINQSHVNIFVHPGYAIIVAGQGEWWEPGDKHAIDHAANNAYRVLRNLGFNDDHILYLNSKTPQHIDVKVDAPALLSNFTEAMNEVKSKIGDNPVPPLILYLVGHGSRGKDNPDLYFFEFVPGGKGDEGPLDTLALNIMLSHFPKETRMLIVVGACYSGGFITTNQSSISASNRIIITMAHNDQKVGYPKMVRCSDRFWGNLNKGLNVKDAFVTNALPLLDSWFLWLDDNGDMRGHAPNDLQDDGQLAVATKIGMPGTENLALTPWQSIWKRSPGELRVYDSQNRVTGLVNGEVREEIPNSMYDEEDEIVAIFSSYDVYRYELVGTETGTYGLEVASVEDGNATIFTAIDIPTSTNATHQYTVDWDALSLGEKGVTVMVDSDGDSIFEYAFTSDSELTHDEFIQQTPQTYVLTITTTVGGTTDPSPRTHTYTANSSVQVTAIPNADYLFDHWELDEVNVGSANPYTVLMDNNHTLRAVFTYSPPPPSLSVSISPLSASILVGQSVTFTSTVSGGYTPYTYQWYLNGNPVSGATSNTWTFTPTTSGIYYVYLKVTDAKANTAQSETARITARTVPVGGYSIPIQLPTTAKPATIHIALLTILTALFITIKRKTKRKH